MQISLPLDEDGYFRRECPLCLKEFKVLLTDEERGEFENGILNSLVDKNSDETIDDEQIEHFCPYCGQNSKADAWWTQEQLEYINSIVQNIFAKILNENLINPLKSSSRNNSNIKFEGKEIEAEDSWIQPETNDMKIFGLPCCQRKIKIQDTWDGPVHCYFCGFIHDKVQI